MKTFVLVTFLGLSGLTNLACAEQQGVSTSEARHEAQSTPGQFVSVGKHEVRGSVRIEVRPEGAYLVLDPDFYSSNGPDLRVVLRDSKDMSVMQIIADLQQTQGAQEYPLNFNQGTLAQFDEVSIYCAKAHVDFGIARLP